MGRGRGHDDIGGGNAVADQTLASLGQGRFDTGAELLHGPLHLLLRSSVAGISVRRDEQDRNGLDPSINFGGIGITATTTAQTQGRIGLREKTDDGGQSIDTLSGSGAKRVGGHRLKLEFNPVGISEAGGSGGTGSRQGVGREGNVGDARDGRKGPQGEEGRGMGAGDGVGDADGHVCLCYVLDLR